jgi:uncharacterized membrane protein YphA (DoxX/SURF4 family)
VHSIQLTLRILYGVVPIVAGLDKFTNFLTDWTAYLNPLVLRIVPVGDHTFMHIAGVIEIIAGVLLLAKPKIGGLIVTAWLVAIALQLLMWAHFIDVAVRDLAMAIGGALTLVRLTPFTTERCE